MTRVWRRQNRLVFIGMLTLIVGTLLFVLGGDAAARTITPTCGWEGTVLHAENLPDEWAMTREPHPIGVSPRPSSYREDWGGTFTAYFWTRGGPYKALFKPGPQLNDYKPVCVAVP